MEYQIIKTSELKALRQKLYDLQGGICPLMKKKYPVEDFCVDHQHRQNKAQEIGDNGAGLIRGAILRQANGLEGKIVNNWKRYALDKEGTSLPDFLRNLADYLEQENLPIVHPTELPKIPGITKSCYNKLKKVVNEKDKLPAYPEKKKLKLTKPLKALFEKYSIEVEYYR
jgi:hypothetical protein